MAPGVVRIDYSATSDADTVVSLTNHTYFNLDGEGTGPVDAHRLAVSADAFTPVDSELIPTGEIRDVTGTPFDLRLPVRLGDVLGRDDEQLTHGKGFDHNLVVTGTGLRPVATLRGSSGRTLEITSDQPGVQVYTGAHFDGTVMRDVRDGIRPPGGNRPGNTGISRRPQPPELPVGETAGRRPLREHDDLAPRSRVRRASSRRRLVAPVAPALLVELRVDVLGQLLGLGSLAGPRHAPPVRRDGVDRRVAHEV